MKYYIHTGFPNTIEGAFDDATVLEKKLENKEPIYNVFSHKTGWVHNENDNIQKFIQQLKNEVKK
jgi:hypothetical protein